MSGRTYHVGVTNVEDLTPRGFSTFTWRTKFCPAGDSKSCPPEQEQSALTKGLVSRDCLGLGWLVYSFCYFQRIEREEHDKKIKEEQFNNEPVREVPSFVASLHLFCVP
jgi:hypothetical protein